MHDSDSWDRLVHELADIEAVPDARSGATLEAVQVELGALSAILRTRPETDDLENEPECREAIERASESVVRPETSWRGGSETVRPPGREVPYETLGQYQLLRKIDEGGMGQVFLAFHSRLHRHVALKILTSHKTRDPRAIRRFEREVQTAGNLSHPNIVSTFDAGEEGGVHYLVMELVDGFNLSELVDRLGPATDVARDNPDFTLADACELIRQAACGLECAHQRGMVHRDIKPSNIMLGASEASETRARVLDFGLALLADDPTDLTAAGQMMGTLSYMSPEQVEHSHGVDVRADIYSLGATLLKLLVGQAPFGRRGFDSPFQLMTAIVHGQHAISKRSHPTLPDALIPVMNRMLAREPRERFATPRDVAEALAPFAQGADLDRVLQQARRRSAAVAGHHNSRTALESTDREAVSNHAVTAIAEKLHPRAFSRRWPVIAGVATVCVAMVITMLALLLNRPAGTTEFDEGLDELARNRVSQEVASRQATAADDSDQPGANPPTEQPPLPNGMVVKPASLPGIGRWQVYTKSPRGGIAEFAWHPSGRWLAVSVFTENTIRIYDTLTWELARLLPYFREVPYALAQNGFYWSPDGRWLAMRTRCWDTNGRPTGELLDVPYTVRHTRWSPDSQQLAVGLPNGDVYLVRPDGGPAQRLAGHKGFVRILSWNADGSWLATSAENEGGQTRLWRADGSVGPVIDGTFVAWHPSGRRLATGGDSQLRIWNVQGQHEETLAGVTDLAWQPDGDARVWRLGDHQFFVAEGDGEPVKLCDGMRPGLVVQWSPAGGSLMFHEIHGGEELHVAHKRDGQWKVTTSKWLPNASAFAWRPDGQQFAVGHGIYSEWLHSRGQSINGVIEIFDLDGTLVKTVTREFPKTTAVRWHPHDDGFVSGARDGKLRVWSNDGKLQRSFAAHDVFVTDVDWHPGGEHLASAAGDGSLRTWHDGVLSGELLPPIDAEQQMYRVRIEPADGRQIYTSRDGGLILNWPDGEVLARDIGGYAEWNQDASSFVSLKDHAVYFWNETFVPRRITPIDDSTLNAVAASPQSGRAVVGGNHALRLCDDGGRVEVAMYRSANGAAEVVGLAWSPDARWIASATKNFRAFRGLRLWHADGRPGPELEAWQELSQMVSLQFDATGRRLLAGGHMGIGLWDFEALRLARLVVPLPDDQVIVFAPDGQPLWATPDADSELVYVAESEDGVLDIVSPNVIREKLLAAD